MPFVERRPRYPGHLARQKFLHLLDEWREHLLVVSHHAVLANADPKGSCEKALPREYWMVLYLIMAEGKPVPKRPPTLRWAMESIAKLGGWTDSKRTGRIGWISLWRGWLDLEAHVEGAMIGAKFADLLKNV